ncbi:MAG: energy-coupling factor transporter transmembrane component T family protein [Zhaonellaceae bacterium]
MAVIDYIPGDSFFHKLDPRVKIIMLVLLTLFIFTTKKFLIITVLFVLVLILWLISGIPIAKIKGFLKLLLPIFFFITVIQALFQVGETALVDPVVPDFIPLIGGSGRITLEGLLFGLVICYRLLTLILLMPLISMTTEVNQMAIGLVKLGMPYKIAYTATTALNMIPSLEEQVRTIMDAQKLRAFTVFEEGRIHEKLFAYPALVVPMVIGAMKKSMLVGVAMDARAFGCKKTRTYIDVIRFTTKDYASLVFLLTLIGVLTYFNLFC